jgi:hypothetical protein
LAVDERFVRRARLSTHPSCSENRDHFYSHFVPIITIELTTIISLNDDTP